MTRRWWIGWALGSLLGWAIAAVLILAIPLTAFAAAAVCAVLGLVFAIGGGQIAEGRL